MVFHKRGARGAVANASFFILNPPLGSCTTELVRESYLSVGANVFH